MCVCVCVCRLECVSMCWQLSRQEKRRMAMSAVTNRYQGHVKHEEQNKQGKGRGQRGGVGAGARGGSEGLCFVDTNHKAHMSVVCVWVCACVCLRV